MMWENCTFNGISKEERDNMIWICGTVRLEKGTTELQFNFHLGLYLREEENGRLTGLTSNKSQGVRNKH